MQRLRQLLVDPQVQVWFNGIAWVAWLCMVPVTLMVGSLRTAILYVALMSVWANFATHYGAWISALVNRKASAIHEHVRGSEG